MPVDHRVATNQSSLRDSGALIRIAYPAINRWAIINRPSGTNNPRVHRARHRRKPPFLKRTLQIVWDSGGHPWHSRKVHSQTAVHAMARFLVRDTFEIPNRELFDVVGSIIQG